MHSSNVNMHTHWNWNRYNVIQSYTQRIYACIPTAMFSFLKKKNDFKGSPV